MKSPSSIIQKNAIKQKTKILFYHGQPSYQSWLYPAALQLKTYIDIFYQDLATELHWFVPVQQELSDDELVGHINSTDTDILCTSHYLWNHVKLLNQLSRIRSRIKKTVKIIAGGPSIDANNNANFFKQNPSIDYAVYGSGEQAFADIVTHLVFDQPLIAFNTSNCAWPHPVTGKIVVADYKFVKMIQTSPFLHNKDFFTAMVKSLMLKNPMAKIHLPYTLTKGCPYSCTFCDWNSGLGNKVSRRKNTYQQEIDLFQKVGIKNIYLSDANVGQYDEDVEMIEYFAQKNLQENAGFQINGNYSKLKKDNNLKIFHTLAQAKLTSKTLNLSIQDINEQVLANIDRPDVGWSTHVAMATELQQAYPHLFVKAQLIYGLPGQTPATWKNTLQEIAQKNIFPMIFLNEPLPASPAMYDPEYQRQFQFEYVLSTRVLVDRVFESLIPKKSSSFDQADIVHMTLLSGLYTALTFVNFGCIEGELPEINDKFEHIVDDFLTSSNGQRLFDNFYHNWTKDNNFYFTEHFNGDAVLVPDTSFGAATAQDPEFLHYVSTFLPPSEQKTFLKTLTMSTKFHTLVGEIYEDLD